MTVHIETVLLQALGQQGDRYIFGTEAKASNPNPTAFDCSELVEWSCARVGVQPTVPDGAYNQWQHCRRNGLEIPVGRGIVTRGALLFVGDGTGSGRDAITHVAWSLGDGTTIEARGAKWGVGTWPSANRFQFAGLLPGVAYTSEEDDDMAQIDQAEWDTLVHAVNKLILPAVGRLEVKVSALGDVDKFAAAIVAKLPQGGVDGAQVEAAVRRVFEDAAKD